MLPQLDYETLSDAVAGPFYKVRRSLCDGGPSALLLPEDADVPFTGV